MGTTWFNYMKPIPHFWDIQSTKDYDYEFGREVKEQIKNLWKREEMYWRQRSRIKWLNQRDRNMKFFHVTTIDRRRRNMVLNEHEIL